VTCLFCDKPSKTYFRVSRTNSTGAENGKAVFLCSILCLIRWAYAYGVKRGVEGVATIQGAIGRLVSAAKAGG
jgi:hypothetical protein